MKLKKLTIVMIAFILSGFFISSAFSKPKTAGDTVEVWNEPDPNGFGIAFLPIANYIAGGWNTTLPAQQVVTLGQATFFDFTYDLYIGDVTSDIAISVRDIYNGQLFTCPDKIPHDNGGPAGNWRAFITLAPGDKLSCRFVKLP